MQRNIYMVKYREPLGGVELSCRKVAENIHQVNRYVNEFLHGTVTSIVLEGPCIIILDDMFPPVLAESKDYVWAKVPKNNHNKKKKGSH